MLSGVYEYSAHSAPLQKGILYLYVYMLLLTERRRFLVPSTIYLLFTYFLFFFSFIFVFGFGFGSCPKASATLRAILNVLSSLYKRIKRLYVFRNHKCKYSCAAKKKYDVRFSIAPPATNKMKMLQRTMAISLTGTSSLANQKKKKKKIFILSIDRTIV